MRRWLAAALLIAGCGPSENSAQVPLDFVLSALLADTISQLQVSIVTNAKSLDCVKVQSTCLIGQVTAADRYVRIQKADGIEHKALLFDLNLKAGATTSSQDVVVQGIPVGKDYALVIEAISKGTPSMLAGSSCNYLPEITPGTNPKPSTATIRPLTPPVNCDPHVKD